ncbi:MAG: type II toxin-antitoxin system Phd/YefM family antitoxin [Rhodospirillaceae bacterium]|nr:type II toxin-antitoxin system Phd/YefM family antitoxin [Rhodospirillaceae bacterium]
MKPVKIADLKAHLSAHLRAVRRGATITVMDRDTPVAQIVPIRQPHQLQVRPAAGRIPLSKIPLPKSAPLDFDIVELLREERQPDR